MSAADRMYRMLLCAYPTDFRAAYQREMQLAFRDAERELHGSTARFWCGIVLDVVRSAPALRLDAMRGRLAMNAHTSGGSMKTMGIVAIVVGVLEMANSMFEVSVGSGWPLLGGSIGVCGGLIFLGTGIMLLRRGREAMVWAQVAAVVCLGIFLLIGPIKPLMSLAAIILGIGYSIALLIFSLMGTRRPSMPGMA